MKRKPLILIPAAALILLSSLACNFPFVSSPTPFVFPTPDLTMTALFNPTVTSVPVVFPTQTPPPAWSSPTASPTGQVPTLTPSNTPLPPTATPTNTLTPTVSYVGPEMRPKFGMVAEYFDTKPTIDGSLDEWQMDRYRVVAVVYGKNNHKGENDLSGRAMIGWDKQNLYLGIRVIDQKYVQNARVKNLYRGDSLDILVDTDVASDFYLGDLNEDDYQLGISPGSPAPGDSPQAYLWFPSGKAGTRGQVSIASRARGDGYIVEAAIPWSVFNIDPVEGQHVGFVFSISDNDNSDRNEQQSMVSFVPIRTLDDPTTWGDLALAKP